MESIKNTDECVVGSVVIEYHSDRGFSYKVPNDWSGKKTASWKKRNQSKIDEAEQRILDRIYGRVGG